MKRNMNTPIARDDLYKLRIVGLATAPLAAGDHFRAARAAYLQARDSLQAAANLHGRQGLAVEFDHELALLDTDHLIDVCERLIAPAQNGRGGR